MTDASRIERLVDCWIGRSRTVDPDAIAATVNFAPAVVVTGGSCGIGAALAAEFARRKTHTIVLVARTEPRLAAWAETLANTFSVRVETLVLDLTTEGSAARLSAFAKDRGLYVDYLVLNAGMGLSGPFVDADPSRIRALLDLNIRSITELMHAGLPAMLARGRGGILTVASLGGYVPGPNQAIYYASKAYVISLTEAVSSEVTGRGVRIAVAAPGPVATGFHDAMGATSALYRNVLPVEKPERVARRIVRGFMWGRTVIVPGITETLFQIVLKVMPHVVTVPLIGAILRRRDRGPEQK